MYQFIESIKIFDGKIFNYDLHQKRIDNTLLKFYPESRIEINRIQIPDFFSNGLFKLRIIYSYKIEKYEIIPYLIPKIESLKIVHSNEINYEFKFFDRKEINELFSKKSSCDDILIVRNGMITDTSFCNTVFFDENKLFTPSSSLLNGVKRQKLLKSSSIEEREIRIEDLNKFSKVFLINAMIDLDDNVCVEITNIKS